MVEIFQIAANIIVLGCLAWLVMRETAGKYATTKDLRSVINRNKQQALEQEQYIKDAFDVLRSRISELSESIVERDLDAYTAEPILGQEKYIRIGAELMREGVDTGHRVIVDALTRDGRLQRDIEPRKQKGPIIIDEFAAESDKDDEGGLPDIIKKMNERLGAELSINGLKGKNG